LTFKAHRRTFSAPTSKENRMRPLLVLFLLAACAAPSSEARSPDTANVGQLRESVMQADRDFAADFAQRRIDGWVSWFDTAGVQVAASGETPRGHAAVRAHMAKQFADSTGILAWRPVMAEVSTDGSMAHTIGTWNFHVRGKDSTATAGTGHYLTVWRRQADGSWKVLADIGTQHPKKK
jgi:ketosteroid isomerase-like protein